MRVCRRDSKGGGYERWGLRMVWFGVCCGKVRGLEWCVGELSCWRRVLKRSMVCGVKVISIRGRIGWEICGWLGDWVVVGRTGGGDVSVGGTGGG